MDASSLNEVLPFVPYLTALLALLPVAAVMWRGQSLFPLRHRLWHAFRRKEAKNPSWLSDDVRERVELLEYRMLFGKADSLAQARRVRGWAAEHHIDLGTLCDCGDHFDRKKLAMSEHLPTVRKNGGWALLLFVVGGLLAVGSPLGLSTNGAVLRFKATHEWAVFGEAWGRPLGQENWTAMTRQDCAGKEDPADFGRSRAAACQVLNDHRLPDFVRSSVRSQHALGALALFYGLLALWCLVRWVFKARAAYAIVAELERQQVTPVKGSGEKPVVSLASADAAAA